MLPTKSVAANVGALRLRDILRQGSLRHPTHVWHAARPNSTFHQNPWTVSCRKIGATSERLLNSHNLFSKYFPHLYTNANHDVSIRQRKPINARWSSVGPTGITATLAGGPQLQPNFMAASLARSAINFLAEEEQPINVDPHSAAPHIAPVMVDEQSLTLALTAALVAHNPAPLMASTAVTTAGGLDRLSEELEELRASIAPLQQSLNRIESRSLIRSRIAAWCSVAFFSAQWLFVFYLIYFVYSWDIMEPITYLMTAFDVIAAYVFFAVVRKDFSPQALGERIFMRAKTRSFKRCGFDVRKYNLLKTRVAVLEAQLEAHKRPLYKNIQSAGRSSF
eukprot:Selendium_serpulae@DN4963_c0_g1_i1.p1